jgi:hypothetical protein
MGQNTINTNQSGGRKSRPVSQDDFLDSNKNNSNNSNSTATKRTGKSRQISEKDYSDKKPEFDFSNMVQSMLKPSPGTVWQLGPLRTVPLWQTIRHPMWMKHEVLGEEVFKRGSTWVLRKAGKAAMHLPIEEKEAGLDRSGKTQHVHVPDTPVIQILEDGNAIAHPAGVPIPYEGNKYAFQSRLTDFFTTPSNGYTNGNAFTSLAGREMAPVWVMDNVSGAYHQVAPMEGMTINGPRFPAGEGKLGKIGSVFNKIFGSDKPAVTFVPEGAIISSRSIFYPLRNLPAEVDLYVANGVKLEPQTIGNTTIYKPQGTTGFIPAVTIPNRFLLQENPASALFDSSVRQMVGSSAKPNGYSSFWNFKRGNIVPAENLTYIFKRAPADGHVSIGDGHFVPVKKGTLLKGRQFMFGGTETGVAPATGVVTFMDGRPSVVIDQGVPIPAGAKFTAIDLRRAVNSRPVPVAIPYEAPTAPKPVWTWTEFGKNVGRNLREEFGKIDFQNPIINEVGRISARIPVRSVAASLASEAWHATKLFKAVRFGGTLLAVASAGYTLYEDGEALAQDRHDNPDHHKKAGIMLWNGGENGLHFGIGRESVKNAVGIGTSFIGAAIGTVLGTSVGIAIGAAIGLPAVVTEIATIPGGAITGAAAGEFAGSAIGYTIGSTATHYIWNAFTGETGDAGAVEAAKWGWNKIPYSVKKFAATRI